MEQWQKLSPADHAALAARHQAQLGTRWQAHTTPPPAFDTTMARHRATAGSDAFGWLSLLGCIGFILLGILLISMLSGCGETAYWWQRTALQIECRPEKLQAGHCVPAR